jgi:hypothetical protein
MKLGHEKQNVVAESVQLFAPCPQSTANGGLSNMVQGTRALMEHTGWRHQRQRQDTHTPSQRRLPDARMFIKCNRTPYVKQTAPALAMVGVHLTENT